MQAMHQNLTEATGGRVAVAPDLEPAQEPADTAPARGAARWARPPATGVVDHLGRVQRLSGT